MSDGTQFLSTSPTALVVRRRALCGAGVVAATLALPALVRRAVAAPPLPAGTTTFRLVWKEREIGRHTVEIVPLGPEGLRVVTSVAIAVKAGPLTVYRFTHDSIEEWQAGQLTSLRSVTNDDGTRVDITGTGGASALSLLTPSGRRQVPGTILTSNSLWTPRFPRQREVLDARQGEVIPVTARAVGTAMASIRGWTMAVDAYDVATTDLSGTLHYLSDRWVGGRMKFKNELVAYELV